MKKQKSKSGVNGNRQIQRGSKRKELPIGINSHKSCPSPDMKWLSEIRENVNKVFAPLINYDKENDILYITWFPMLDCKYSLETTKGIIFDITENDKNKFVGVKGIEIFDFKKRFIK